MPALFARGDAGRHPFRLTVLEIVQLRATDLGSAPLGRRDAPLVVMPSIDAAQARRAATQLAGRAGTAGVLAIVADTERQGFIAVANAAFRCSVAPAFAYVAEDAFAGRDWLRCGAAALARDAGGLLAFHDGKWHGALAAFGLVERDWAAANYGGDLFWPGYRSHYADVELTVLALAAGGLRHDPDALLVEVDWQKDRRAVDAGDRALFAARRAGRFGGRAGDLRAADMFN